MDIETIQQQIKKFFSKIIKKFFRTGDLGKLVEGKFLQITGRIKEQFKLENGKFVVPAPVEDVFCRSPFIAQVYIYGVNHPYTVALVVPSWPDIFEYFHSGAGKTLLPAGVEVPNYSPEQLTKLKNEDVSFFKEPVFINLINEELMRISEAVKSYERPIIWHPLAMPFSQDNQQLTPKMSLRRVNIMKMYEKDINEMYEGKKGIKVAYKKQQEQEPKQDQ